MDEQILIGFDPETGEPFYLGRELFERSHLHSQGGSGSGKSLFQGRLLAELMASSESALFTADLAGNSVLRPMHQDFAERNGRPYREFILGERTSFFEPLSRASALCANLSELSDWTNSALGGNHGVGFGQGYFSGENRRDLQEGLEELRKRGVVAPTLHQLAETMRRKKRGRDATETRTSLLPLLEYAELGDTTDEENRIDFARALEDREVIYFGVDPLINPMMAEKVVGLAVGLIVLEAIRRTMEGKERRHMYVAIDEFGHVAGPRWESLLTGVRKHHLSFHCLNQSRSQLDHRYSRLSDLMVDNANIRLLWSPYGEDVDHLQGLSDESTRILGGISGHGLGMTSMKREIVDRILSANEIHDVAGTAREFFLVWNDGCGHHEPKRLRAPEIPKDEFERFERISREKIAAKAPKKKVVSKSSPVDERRFEEVLLELVAEKVAAETLSE